MIPLVITITIHKKLMSMQKRGLSHAHQAISHTRAVANPRCIHKAARHPSHERDAEEAWVLGSDTTQIITLCAHANAMLIILSRPGSKRIILF